MLGDELTQLTVVNGTISGWWPITGGIIWGSILCPILFIILISDMDVGVEWIFKVSDDTKLEGAVDSMEGQDALQKDPYTLWKSTKENVRFWTWDEAMSDTCKKQEISGWRAAQKKRMWGCCLTAGSVLVSSVPWQSRGMHLMHLQMY